MNNNLGKIIGYTFVVLIIVYLIYTPPIRSAYYDLENVFNGTSIISLDSIILTSGIFLLGLFFGSGIFGWMQNKNFKKIVIILLGLLAISCSTLGFVLFILEPTPAAKMTKEIDFFCM